MAAGTSGMIQSQIATLFIQASGQRLIIVPSSMPATEGTTALLRCRVVDKAGTLSWLQNSQPISYDGDVSNSIARYSIVGDHAIGDFNLQIEGLRTTDQGTYHCIVSEFSGTGNLAISSSGATLTVLPATAPDAGYPACSMNPSTGLKEGDNLTISCTSRGGEPQPSLQWLRNNVEYAGVYTAQDLTARNDATFTLTNSLVDAQFECLASHPTYTTAQKCDLAPLIFELNPTIEISLDVTTFEIKVDESGSVNCIATGDPPVTGYQWSFSGVNIDSATDQRFVIVHDAGYAKSTLTVVAATLSMDENSVQCEAKNRVDKRAVYAVVKIIEDDLYQIVLAVLFIISIFVLALIVAPIIGGCCYRRNQKKRKVAPIEDGLCTNCQNKMSDNHFITNDKPTPNGKLRMNPGPEKLTNVAANAYDECLSREGVFGNHTPLPELTSYRSNRWNQPTVIGHPVDSTMNVQRGMYEVENKTPLAVSRSGSVLNVTKEPVSTTDSAFLVPEGEYEKKLMELELIQRSITASGILQDDSKSRVSRMHDDTKSRRSRHHHKRRNKEDKAEAEEDNPRKSKSKEHKSKEHKERKEHRDKKEKKRKTSPSTNENGG